MGRWILSLALALAVGERVEVERLEVQRAMQNRSLHQEPSSDLDQTVRKKNWECGEPEGKKDMVKNPKKKAAYMVYNHLKLKVCPQERGSIWQVVKPEVSVTSERCTSSITGRKDSSGCLSVPWAIGQGFCGMVMGRFSKLYPRTDGTAVVLCSDLLDPYTVRTYKVDDFERSTRWY
mmetsp:Transcript_28143/g.66861  ORF Transcript_28143/g.66861 Transcript_28143/m.66861 type:complete len:177 (-) Transcript_28143:184-714(-)